jgi:hypothetical protein
MNLVFCSSILITTVMQMAASSVSYVALQVSPDDGGRLVRVSADAKSVQTIAKGIDGVSLAVDGTGNYIAANHSTLVQVTRAGVVSVIANAPPESDWVAVAVDKSNNLIVGDLGQRALWRVSQDRKAINRIATLPGKLNTGRRIGIGIDGSGDYLVLAPDDRVDEAARGFVWPGYEAHLYKISHAGAVTDIPLHGVSVVDGAALTPDGKGSFLFIQDDYKAVLRLHPRGKSQTSCDWDSPL